MSENDLHKTYLEDLGKKVLEDAMFIDIEYDPDFYYGLSTSQTKELCKLLVGKGWIRWVGSDNDNS